VTLTILICAAAWVLGWWAFGRVRRLDRHPAPTGAARRVSIVIPARDEELSLPSLLADLGHSRPAGSQVVVVDDHSSDRTREIAASHPFVEVVDAPDLPDGWTGKCWACHTGAEHATGDVIVFLDADVRLADGALDRLVAELDEGGAMVSVQPWHETERPYEQLSGLFNVIAVMGTGAGGRGEPTGAFGPVMASSADAYHRVGGHAAVRDEVVEDLALAARFRESGERVDVLTGGSSIRFRMYPAGVRQVVEGWTKNFASGAGSTRPIRLAAIVVWVTGLGSGAIALVDGFRGALPLALGLTLYALFVAQLYVLFRQVGRFGPVTALLYPLLLVFFVVVFVRSVWNTHVRRTVQWRGRRIPVGAARS
jgi:4,4'-diaponeurosporenoate glycosyltransferase